MNLLDIITITCKRKVQGGTASIYEAQKVHLWACKSTFPMIYYKNIFVPFQALMENRMDINTFLPEFADVLLPKDLQIILHVGRNTVYRLLDDGSIKSIKVGNCYRIPKMNLFDYLYPDNQTRKEALNE